MTWRVGGYVLVCVPQVDYCRQKRHAYWSRGMVTSLVGERAGEIMVERLSKYRYERRCVR